MIDLEFTELDPPREITATPSELRTLRRARHGLRIEELGDDRVRVGPRIGYAGTVLLPTGRRIVVMPKAPISNLPELLALAYRAMALPLAAGAAAIDEAIPTDWLLLQLIGEIEELLSRGFAAGTSSVASCSPTSEVGCGHSSTRLDSRSLIVNTATSFRTRQKTGCCVASWNFSHPLRVTLSFAGAWGTPSRLSLVSRWFGHRWWPSIESR